MRLLRVVAPFAALALLLAGCGGATNNGNTTSQTQSTDGATATPPASPQIRSGSFHCEPVNVSTPEKRETFGFSGGVKYEQIGGKVCIGDESKMPQARSCLNPPGNYTTNDFNGELDRSKSGCSPPLWVCDGGPDSWAAGEETAAARDNFALRGYSCNPYTSIGT